MKDFIRFGVTLAVLAMLSSLGLAAVNRVTKPVIDEMRAEKAEQARNEVLPEAKEFVPDTAEVPGGETIEFFRGKGDDGRVVGYAFITETTGYSSDIRIMIGLDTSFKIKAVKIMYQAETPGLGTRVEEVESSSYIWNFFMVDEEKSRPWFQKQFSGLNGNSKIGLRMDGEYPSLSEDKKKQYQENNEISGISGATISSRAVVDGVNKGINQLRDAIKGI